MTKSPSGSWCFLLLLLTSPAAGEELSATPVNLDFEAAAPLDGWGGGGRPYERAIDATTRHGGAKAARMRYTGNANGTAQAFGTFTQAVSAAGFLGQKVRYSGWLRTQGVASGWAGMWMRVDGSGRGDVLAFDNMDTSKRAVRGTTDWTRYSIVLDVPKEATAVYFGALLAGDGTLWVDDLAVELAPADAPTTGTKEGGAEETNGSPGIVEARGAYTMTTAGVGDGLLARLFGMASRSASPRILLPVVLAYGDQVPLTYRLTVTPHEKLVSARIMEDRPGNPVAEVVVAPLAAGEEVQLEWSALVACGPGDFDDVPKQASLPTSFPAEVQPWLRSTRCVQSDDERIRKVAAEIRGDSTDVMAIISATLTRARSILAGETGRCSQLDAVSALTKQGSCTSCANLVAALLRANGIPARILSGYPTWSGPLQTHYIVEAFVPRWGWYPIESTALRAPWPPYQQVEVAIVPPDYEDRSAGRPAGAGGVPYLSLTETPDNDRSFLLMGTIDKSKSCDHVATQAAAFPKDALRADWDRALKAAGSRWDAWLQTKPVAAAGSGTIEFQPVSPEVLKTVKDPATLATTIGN